MLQIRLNKTPELAEVLAYFQNKYRLLSEAEIIKMALAEKYSKEAAIPFVDEETEKLIAQGMEDIKHGHYTELRTKKEITRHLDSL